MVLLAAAVSTPCRLRMKMMLEPSSIEGCCHYHHYLPKNIERGRAVGNFILLFHLPLLESGIEKMDSYCRKSTQFEYVYVCAETS